MVKQLWPGENVYIRSEKGAIWKEKRAALKCRGVRFPNYKIRKNTEYVSTEQELISRAKRKAEGN